MDEGSARLRDRMLRDAILEVLRGNPASRPAGCSVAEFVRRVTVEDGRARIELVPMSSLVGAVRCWVESLPEVTRADVTVAGNGDTKEGLSCT